MSHTQQTPPKVFISYAHSTNTFANKILYFSNNLRTEQYIDANIDQYEESPPQGWQRWMDEQIRDADYVLVICTQDYMNKLNNYATSNGKGVNWEVNIIYQHLYDACCNNSKFIPILLNDGTPADIPTPLRSSTFYNIEDITDFKKLCNRLKGIPNTIKPALGSSSTQNLSMHPLPEKSRKTLFITSFIDIKQWDSAKWHGIVYAFYPDMPPIMCLLYKNKEAGRKIFSDWLKEIQDKPFEDLSISIIQDNSGYYGFISTNMDRCIKRMEDMGLTIEDSLIHVTSRYQYMVQEPLSPYLNLFKSAFSKYKQFYIAPAHLSNPQLGATNDNIHIDMDVSIPMTSIKFINKSDLTPNDIEYIVIEAPLSND